MGNIYEIDIRVETIAGEVGKMGNSDGAVSFINGVYKSDAKFSYPEGLALDSSGNVFVADMWNHRIRKITPEKQVFTIAGTGSITGILPDGTAGISIDNADPKKASFNGPWGLAIDADGNLYVTEYFGKLVRKLVKGEGDTYEVITIGGLRGNSVEQLDKYGDAPVNAQEIYFGAPTGIAVNSKGVVYVLDVIHYCIRKLTPTSDPKVYVSEMLNKNEMGCDYDRIELDSARMNRPMGIAVDSNDNLYFTDINCANVRKATNPNQSFSSWMVSNVIGDGVKERDDEFASDDKRIFGRVAGPKGIATDGKNNIYIVDNASHSILRRKTDGTTKTLAGKVGTSGYADGSGSSALFNSPSGIAVDADGTSMYISDNLNHCIRRVLVPVEKIFTMRLYRDWNFVGFPLNDYTTRLKDSSYDNAVDTNLLRLVYKITKLLPKNQGITYDQFIANESLISSVVSEIQQYDANNQQVLSYVPGVGGDVREINSTSGYFIKITNAFPQDGLPIYLRGVSWGQINLTLRRGYNWVNLPHKSFLNVDQLFESLDTLVMVQRYKGDDQLFESVLRGGFSDFYLLEGGRGYLLHVTEDVDMTFFIAPWV